MNPWHRSVKKRTAHGRPPTAHGRSRLDAVSYANQLAAVRLAVESAIDQPVIGLYAVSVLSFKSPLV